MAFNEPQELSPELLGDIQRALGMTRAEFGKEIGVSGQTVQRWEQGESEPSTENRAAIWDLIPDDVDVQDLGVGVLWGKRLPLKERRLYGSEKLQRLREGPVISEEIGGLKSLSPSQRQFVERLSVTGAQGASKRKPGTNTVYFLAGDERRAVRRFIEENESFVEQAMASRNNKLSAEWDDFRYQLLLDEWRFYLAEHS